MSVPTIECASRIFIERIGDPSRRGKVVELKMGTPGLANAEWNRGAYGTTLARNAGEGLNSTILSGFAARASRWPLTHGSQADFDKWHAEEVEALAKVVAAGTPVHASPPFWTFGRAQKFMNILLKYGCAVYHSGYPHFAIFAGANPDWAKLTPFLHAPVDSLTLKHVATLPDAVSKWRYISWSRALAQETYDEIQKCIRKAATAKGISPIHYEMVYIW